MEEYRKILREFAFLATQLYRRGIEVSIRADEPYYIWLKDKKANMTIKLESASELKAFARGIDWGVANARRLAECGGNMPICKE